MAPPVRPLMATDVSKIIGWSPPDNADFVPVDPAPARRLRRTTTGIFHHPPPDSASDSDDPAADKAADGSAGSKHDPGWVARPRNEFILFRCDYVRKHSREGGKRTRRPPGAEAEKTLSKQAAEAWHHLPPEERLYWKEQANGERNEHARRYPDYRYRPKKSATGRRRQSRGSPSKAESAPSIEKIASPLKSHASMPAMHHHHHHQSAAVGAHRPPAPTRHASVPHFHLNDAAHRRLRSTASAGWLGVAPARTDALAFPADFARMHLHDQGPAFQPTDYISSSSLLNWNGARMVSSPLQPTQYLSPASVTMSPLPALDATHVLAEYTTGGNPEPAGDEPQNQTAAQSQSQNQNQNQSQSQDHMYAHYASSQDDLWLSQLHYPGEQHAGITSVSVSASASTSSDALGSGSAAASSEITGSHSHEQPSGSTAGSGTAPMYHGSDALPQIVMEYSNVDLLHHPHPGHPQTADPSAIFAMDGTEDYFNPNY